MDRRRLPDRTRECGSRSGKVSTRCGRTLGRPRGLRPFPVVPWQHQLTSRRRAVRAQGSRRRSRRPQALTPLRQVVRGAVAGDPHVRWRRCWSFLHGWLIHLRSIPAACTHHPAARAVRLVPPLTPATAARVVLPLRCLFAAPRCRRHGPVRRLRGRAATQPQLLRALRLAAGHAAALCGECQRRVPPWDAAWAPFRYGWPLDRLESRYKFGADLAAGRVLPLLWHREPCPVKRRNCC